MPGTSRRAMALFPLESFKGAHHIDWNLTMAATVLVMAPVILVFFFAQKAFVEGVTLTGVKGQRA